jgi:uncharacterized membrane protein
MTRDPAARASRWGAVLVGVALSGFFDGILLHQVLQWHHLLSGVHDPDFMPLERQVLADGLFHVLMYAVAAAGLWLLWRARGALTADALGRRLPIDLLLGFGAWNVIDVVGFHWLAGIHRVRMDSPQPLLWDWLWLIAFGLLPLAAAWWLRRPGRRPPAAPSQGRTRSGGGLLTWMPIALAVGAAGYWASRPPPGAAMVVVLYSAATSGASILRGVDAVGGRVRWVNASGTVWALDVADKTSLIPLYRHGALFTTATMGLAGCTRWTRL